MKCPNKKVFKLAKKLLWDLDFRTDLVAETIGVLAQWMHETAEILANDRPTKSPNRKE